MTEQRDFPDPITFLEGLLPGNIFAGKPPLPRVLVELMREQTPVTDPDKPGCTAAEPTILTLGFLDGPADGMGGFGVLRQGKEYLERGAASAETLGQGQLARELRSIAQELSQVRTPDQARRMAERLRPLKALTWQLGKDCDHLYLVWTEAIIPLAERVAEGESSLQDANEIVKHAS